MLIAIAILQASAELRSELATNALLDVKDNFNAEKTATLYRQLFWQLIEEKEKKVRLRKTTKTKAEIDDEYSENGEPSNKELRKMAEEDYYRRMKERAILREKRRQKENNEKKN